MSRSNDAVAAEAVAVGAGAGAMLASPVESVLKGFAGYLRDERGVAELTVAAYLPDVRRFLARRRDCDVGGLTAAEVSKAVLGEVASRSPASVRRYQVRVVGGHFEFDSVNKELLTAFLPPVVHIPSRGSASWP
jgi:hypothetical protein